MLLLQMRYIYKVSCWILQTNTLFHFPDVSAVPDLDEERP
jgi:hypothetical protein